MNTESEVLLLQQNQAAVNVRELYDAENRHSQIHQCVAPTKVDSLQLNLLFVVEVLDSDHPGY